jgi:hypothetical protein
MFNAAQDLPWMDALEKIIDVMMRRICTCWKKYDGDDTFVVLSRVRRLINTWWEATASISVMKLARGWIWCVHNEQVVQLRWSRR